MVKCFFVFLIHLGKGVIIVDFILLMEEVTRIKDFNTNELKNRGDYLREL